MILRCFRIDRQEVGGVQEDIGGSNGQIAETKCVPNRRQFGAIRTEPGNLRLRRTAWWGWEDSNLQPNDYQPPALSIEQSGAVS